MDQSPIIVERTYSASPDAVWRAITDPRHMRQWFFPEMADFRPEVGFEVEFTVHYQGRDYVHQWKVTAVVPGRTLVYDWLYGGVPGRSAVAWQLTPEPGGTRLTLTHTGQSSFPQADPAFRRASCQSGWDYFLHDSLAAYLDRRPV